MKLIINLCLVTASLLIGLISTASAQYCYSPADIGGTTYQLQGVRTAAKNNRQFEMFLDVVSLRCTESYGRYSWQPTRPLDSYQRQTSDGIPYEVSILNAEARLTTDNYELVEAQVVQNNDYQTFRYVLTTNEIFSKSRQVRLRFYERFTTEVKQEGTVFRPPPTNGPETYIDLRM